VALGAGGRLSGNLGGVVLGVITAATWAGYSILVAQLMRRYRRPGSRRRSGARSHRGRPCRSSSQNRSRLGDLGAPPLRDAGPLVLTNELWFRSLDRIGPARATLAANLQPFLAAAIAVALLSETLTC
jgi:drug/metabolite transporter (DMT)-like permease